MNFLMLILEAIKKLFSVNTPNKEENRKAFYEAIKPIFNGVLKQTHVDNIELILNETKNLSLQERAYILATVKHETAHTMQPIREYGKGRGKKYGKIDSTGKAPYGRGYVQLTWRFNYERADKELGLKGKLAADYDLALDPKIAVKILVKGCVEGWFTGKKLSDYLPKDYVNARRVVNGTDKAQEIANLAEQFEQALLKL